MSKFLLNIIIILFSIFTISCSRQKNTETSSNIAGNKNLKEASTLKWLGFWYGEGKKEVMVREVAREFSLLNQDIDLQLYFPQQVFSYTDESQLFSISFQEIAKMAQKNDWPWDVMLCDQGRYSRVAQLLKDPEWGKKYLVDFSNEPWLKESHINNLFEKDELAKSYGGIIPGPVLEGIAYVLYESEYVEQLLGIKVKRFDMQLSDFVSYAKAVYSYNQSHQEKISFLSMQYDLAIPSIFAQLVMSEYGKAEYSGRQESLNALKTVYEALEKMAIYKPLEQCITFPNMTYDALQRILRQDKFLFYIQPSWMYLLWNNTNPEGTKIMKPCEIPSMDGKISPTYPGVYQVIFVVPKNGKNVEAAKKLVRFISTEETAEKWIKYSKCPTGLKTKISYSDFGQEEFELYFRNLQKKYGNRIKEVNLSYVLFGKNLNINFNAENVLMGKMSATEALRTVEKQLR